MDKLPPREIVKMANLAGKHEARRNDSRRLARSATVRMDVANLIRPVRGLEFEQSTAEGGQPATAWTHHPAWKGRDGNTRQRGGRKRIPRGGLWWHRSRPQRLDL